MKSTLKILMLASAAGLAACGGSPEEKAAKKAAQEAALRVCPPSEVLADISSYSNEMAPADLAQAEWFEANGKMDGVKATKSGLQYKVNKSGNAKGPMPLPTQTVRVNYHGQFLDGNMFDSSYERGEDIEFPLNRVIKGWTEGVGLMRPCDAWTLYIPSDLAYGPNGRGSIPPATPLVFHVQLIEVTDPGDK
jgi:FKBP-type peptidyl-prolyl cis-trans isomerase